MPDLGDLAGAGATDCLVINRQTAAPKRGCRGLPAPPTRPRADAIARILTTRPFGDVLSTLRPPSSQPLAVRLWNDTLSPPNIAWDLILRPWATWC